MQVLPVFVLREERREAPAVSPLLLEGRAEGGGLGGKQGGLVMALEGTQREEGPALRLLLITCLRYLSSSSASLGGPCVAS